MKRSQNVARLSALDSVAVRQFADAVRRALGDRLLELRLYGSKARGTGTAESDIDVVAILRDTDWRVEERIVDIAFDVNLEHDVFISPMVIAREKFDDPVWRITDLAVALDEESIPL